MRTVTDSLLDILFPRLCLLCGKNGVLLCRECTEELPSADALSIPSAFALWRYSDTGVKKILWHFKYRGGKLLAGIFALLLYQKITARHFLPADVNSENVIVTPIPITRMSRWRRGFNQSALIAEKLSAFDSRFQFSPRALTRTRRGKRQTAQKNRADRIRNMENAFAGDTSLAGRDVIVIDDIATTGATLGGARRALLAAGARRVYAFVIAH